MTFTAHEAGVKALVFGGGRTLSENKHFNIKIQDKLSFGHIELDMCTIIGKLLLFPAHCMLMCILNKTEYYKKNDH